MARTVPTRVRRRERGSALVEAAIVIPVLVLLIYWSAAITDVMVLKLKGEEAARFALWETTVFRAPAQISADVHSRFADLRSPASENRSYTGLMLYPRASNVRWSAHVDPNAIKVGLGGTSRPPPGASWWMKFFYQVVGFFGRAVNRAVERQQFNVYGCAEAYATLDRASSTGSTILQGGDLLGNRGGNDLGHPASMSNFTFRTPLPSERPLRLIFDTWKAWPKPAAYTYDGAPTNINVSPMQTYPTVEEQVSAQVDKIAFYGMNRLGWLSTIRSWLRKLVATGFLKSAMGGLLPDPFSTGRMDDPQDANKGPITILPVERPVEGWAPGRTLATNRLGMQLSTNNTPFTNALDYELTDKEDRSRYTVPYRINSRYWTADGGASDDLLSNKMATLKPQIATQNEYVNSFACRGHYFAGAIGPQLTDPTRRYRPACANR